MAVYATVADMHDVFDWKEVGQLLSDTNQPVSALEQLTTGNVYNTRLLRFLARASGEIETVLLKNGRYAVTDLSGLTGNAAEVLTALTCEFAMVALFERKPLWKPEVLDAWRKIKSERLKLLGSGDNIFGLPLVVAAGKTVADGPTSVDYDTVLNLVTDRVKGYPRRALPYNR